MKYRVYFGENFSDWYFRTKKEALACVAEKGKGIVQRKLVTCWVDC